MFILCWLLIFFPDMYKANINSIIDMTKWSGMKLLSIMKANEENSIVRSMASLCAIPMTSLNILNKNICEYNAKKVCIIATIKIAQLMPVTFISPMFMRYGMYIKIASSG